MPQPPTCGKCGTTHWSAQPCPGRKSVAIVREALDPPTKTRTVSRPPVPRSAEVVALNVAPPGVLELAEHLGLDAEQTTKLAAWTRAQKAEQMRQYRARAKDGGKKR